MFRRTLLSLTASLFMFTNVTPAHAFHGSQGSSGALTAQADSQSGSASFGVPIDVPPGRAGIQPNIQLQYSSSLPNGLLGVGWSLELGSIQRSTKNGAPKYDSSDAFILVQSGSGQELVYDPTAGFYRAKVEGAFMRIQKIGDEWVVTDKKGIKYHFGTTQSAQEYDPANTSRIFKWALSSVEDLQGNTMTITYWRADNKIYPQYIDYTANPSNGLAGFARVEFLWVPRPDTMSGYTAGFLMETNYRLNRINAWIGTDLQYRFDLTYHASNATGRSLLDTITQYGADGVSTLPPLTFQHQEYVNEPAPTYSVNTISNGQHGDNLWNHQTSVTKLQGNYNNRIVAPAEFTWGPTSKTSSGSGRLNLDLQKDYVDWFWTYLYSDNAKQLPVSISGAGNVGVWVNGNLSGNVWSLNQGYNRIDVTVYRQKLGGMIIGGIVIIEDPTYSFSVDTPIADNVVLMNSDQQGQQLSKFFGDFNGDSRTDKAAFDRTAGTINVELSNGMSFATPTLWISNVPSDVEILTGNFNADGATDIGFLKKSTGQLDVALSGNNQFNGKTTWITGFGDGNKQVSTGDFNGDGLTDVVEMFNNSGGSLQAQIVLSTGTSFTAINGAVPILSATSGQGITGDFNGDGLTDLGVFSEGNGYWEIRLNTGDIKAPFVPMPTVSGFGAGKHNVAADFNHDGVIDIGYYDNGSGNIVYRLASGNAFLPAQTKTLSLSLRNSDVYVQAADLNGDGLPDFVAANTLGAMELAYSNGVAADLLATSNNGVGGTTTIQYAPSTTFNNPQLPFPLQLVKSANQSNSRGDVYTTKYEYSGGLWNGAAREFHGFGTVKVTDPDGNYSESTFLQDDIFKGRVSEQRAYDSAGRLFSKTVNTWGASQQITPGVDFAYLQRKDNFIYDGDTTGRRTLEEYFYEETPQLGNLTRAAQYGEVDLATGGDIGTDKRSVETAYFNNTSSWLIGLPRQTTVKDNAGNIVRQSWFYYDNQGNTTVPIKGFLTKKEDWAGTGNVNPVTLYSYDAIGNLSTTTDPKGNITRVTYDPTYKMFPLTTENTLTHKVVNEYFGVNSVPLTGSDGLSGLWGQVRSTTDPNQQQGKRSYDIFGRLTTTIAPLDSLTYPTQTTAIKYFSDYTKVTGRQRIKSGQPQMLESVSFYDGLGRLIQSKTPSEVLGRYVVGGQAEYDSRGLKSKQYLPYFSASSVNAIDPINFSAPRSTIEYDAMGRAVKTINPDGTWASASYDDWMTAATDENGHKQASYFDAYGRLAKKEEYTGADGRSPNYPAKPYTLYATTLYTYDSEGNLLQTKDAYNNITTITYDVLGRKTAMTDPDMGAWSYAYDLNGNLTKQIDAKGQTLTFTYDALNRLTNKTDGVNGTVNVNYTYDNTSSTNSKGRLTQATYAGGNTQFAYDELGRELQSIKTMNTTNYGVNRGYNALNNLLQVQYPDQKNIYYKYNGAGQIEAISNDATILPQSFNWDGEKTEQFAYYLDFARDSFSRDPEPVEGLVSRIPYLVKDKPNEIRDTNDERRDTSDEIRDTRTVLSSFASWLERNVLGVGEAEATPVAPVLNTAASGNAQVSLSWGAVSGATGYKVKYGTTSGGGSGAKDFTKDVDCVAAWKFNETSGTVTDSCKAIHGTASGTLLRGVAGKYNQGIEFLGYASGNNALVNFGSDVSLDNLRARTLVAWINPHTLGEGSMGTILDKNYQDGWILRLAANNNIAFSQAFGGGVVTWTTTTNALRLNTWQHVAVTYTGSGTSAVPVIYINGVAQAVSGGIPYGTIDNDAAYNLLFGINGGIQEFDGVIDEAAVFKRVLTSTEIAGIMNNRLDGGVGMTYATQLDVGNVTGYTATGLTNGTTYYFVVSAKDAVGESLNSNERSAIPVAVAPPAAPVLNTATAGDKQVALTWAAATGATGYKIYYGTSTGVYGAPITVGNVTSSTVTGLTTGTTYYFAVSGTNTSGESARSNEKSAASLSTSIQPLITLEAETMPTKTTGGAVTDGWNIWSNGYVEGTVNFPESTTYEFQIIAKGSYAGGAWPNMELRVDQTVNASFTVNTTGWGSYTRQITVPSGSHKVAIAFTNDYYVAPDDRNLYVDKVAILKVVLGSPPSVPVLNTAVVGDKQVTLTWAAATGATGYKIYYGTAAGVYGAPITVGSTTTSTVTGLTNGTTYYFAVSGTNTSGESVRSSEKSATPAAPMTENPTLFIKNVDYNASGQMTKVEYGNGDITTYTYNSLNLRLTRLYTVNAQLQPVQDLNYTYDSAGNILSITDNVNTADQTFKYDELNRLVEAVNPNPGSYGTKSYTYDKIGNIVSKDGKTYFYGGTSGGPHAVTSTCAGATCTNYTYDSNGNMVTKVESGVTTNYKYDSENRLIEVKKGGTIIGQYTYDGDGGRTTKVATVSGQTTTTTFVGSLFETDSKGRGTKFIFLGGQRVAAVTSSPSIGTAVLYYHSDHLGGANVLTDATGFKKELIEYEPFGLESRHEKYGSSEEVAWYYFTGKKSDDESGLIYFGARYYDPKLGRFITADTIVQAPHNPQTLNRYSYCANDPVNHTDPTGHGFWKSVKKFFQKYGNFVSPLARAIITDDWKSFGMIAVSAVAAVASFGVLAAVTPMVMTAQTATVIGISALATTAVLDTSPGRWLIDNVSKQIFDDAFGMSPKNASIAGSLFTHMAVNAGFQSYFASQFAPNGELTSKLYKYDAKNPRPLDVDVQKVLDKGEGFNYFNKPRPFPQNLEQVNRILYNSNGELVGAIGKTLLGQHTSIVLSDISSITGRIDLAHFPNMSHQYGLWGISHQAVNVSLLEAGYSSTVMSVGGGWTTGVSTVVYGPYGGGAVGATVASQELRK